MKPMHESRCRRCDLIKPRASFDIRPDGRVRRNCIQCEDEIEAIIRMKPPGKYVPASEQYAAMVAADPVNQVFRGWRGASLGPLIASLGVLCDWRFSEAA